MSHNNKKSIVVLGNGESLKTALITKILGKDLSQAATEHGPCNTEIYENEDVKITCTPELSTSHEDIKNLFGLSQHPDLCLLVVQDKGTIEEVWEQIEELSRTTGKPREEFTVVPPGCKNNYAFKFYNMGQILRLFRKTNEGDGIQNKKRFIDSNSSTDGQCSRENCTAPGKSLKRKLPGTTVNLVLLGLTGAGKSSSANTILGRNHFKSEPSSNPTTTDCQLVETQMGGRCVRVIDTPDIFDDDLDKSVKNKHVAMCKQLCQSEPCVYLLVLEVGRFTDGERNILTKAEETFGSEARNKTIILFTRGDDLRYVKKSKEDFINNCQADLKALINQCGGRVVVFDNKDPNLNPHQVEELMQTVEKTLTGHRN